MSNDQARDTNGVLGVFETAIVGEVTMDELGLVDDDRGKRRTPQYLRAAKGHLLDLSRVGDWTRIFWERMRPDSRELYADMILADVIKEREVVRDGNVSGSECYVRLTDKGCRLVDRIKAERITTTRVA